MPKKSVKKKKAKESISCEIDCCCSKHKSKGSCIYGLGFIGSAIYFISTSTSFWNGVWGFVKSLAWPAFLVYELLKFLGA